LRTKRASCADAFSSEQRRAPPKAAGMWGSFLWLAFLSIQESNSPAGASPGQRTPARVPLQEQAIQIHEQRMHSILIDTEATRPPGRDPANARQQDHQIKNNNDPRNTKAERPRYASKTEKNKNNQEPKPQKRQPQKSRDQGPGQRAYAEGITFAQQKQ
ncbi:MAG: hypothetical protein QM639_20160, partial [Rhodocyclaceae bacterium]